MSQSNKSHLALKLFLFIIIFAVASCGVTYYMINQKLNSTEISSVSNDVPNNIAQTKLEDDGVKGLDNIYETYQPNNLEIVRYAYYDKPKLEGLPIVDDKERNLNDIDSTEYAICVYYVQIDGLKDEDVQEKINKRIKRAVLEKVNEKKDEDYMSYSIWSNVNANFANVLSVFMYENTDISEDNYKFVSHGLNFDLNTGREIKFKDVFTYNAGIKNLLSHYAYQSLAISDYSYEDYADMDKVDYSDIEDNALRIMQSYNENQDIEFYLTANSVVAIINEKEIAIPMVDCMEQIAIYHRYLSNKDLFEEEPEYDMETNILIPSSESNNYYQFARKVSDNVFAFVEIEKAYYDWENTNDEVDIPKEDFEEMLNDVWNTINEYKEMDDGKARLYEISSYNYDPNSDIKYEINEVCLEGDSEYCENTFFPWAIKKLTNQMESGFIYESDLDEKMSKHLKVEENRVYREDNSMTYEEYQEENEDVYDDFEPTARGRRIKFKN